MKQSVVNIESIDNNSFGTGFIIDSDERGVYILTCQHVLDDVVKPVVDNVLAKIIAKSDFIDMAVLYVSKLHINPLPLQLETCNTLDVDVIGFSNFNKSVVQKKHISATLYPQPIELHSKENDLFYNVRKIKANDGFNFDRGNSGSPVICKNSGKVIAMISNKEGNNIGYAVDIANIKEVWKEMPTALLHPSTVEKAPISKREENFEKKRQTPFIKYLLSLLIVMALSVGGYLFLKPLRTVIIDRTQPVRFNLILTDAGKSRIQTIKAIRSVTGLGLKQSKEMSENLPSTIKKNLSKEEVTKLKREMERSGASFRIEREK